MALYYGHDQYGSTRLLTDATGAVAATFTYDPYGNLAAHTGTADTPLRWNGQYQDADTGLYYLRARYYDPQTAQFLTRDPLAALTLAPYQFGAADPLSFSDPLGLDWWNPTTWTGQTWAAVGTAVALVAIGVATAGIGDAVIVGAIERRPGTRGTSHGLDSGYLEFVLLDDGR